MESAFFNSLVKALTATKDPAAVQSAFDVVKNVAKPTIHDFVRAATRTKNPKAVEAVFKTVSKNKGVLGNAIKVLGSTASHALLTPIVIPEQALEHLERMKQGKGRIKT